MTGRDTCKAHSGDPDVGRPTVLDEDTHHRVVQLVRAGNYFATAARAAGINPATFYSWLERGSVDLEAERDTPFARFAESVERAKAEAQATSIAIIRTAANQGDWKAAAWLLERQYPQDFGLRQDVRHSGGLQQEHSGRVSVSHVAVVPEPTHDQLVEVAMVLQQIGALPDVGAMNGDGENESNGGGPRD